MITASDAAIVRELAKRVSDIAALPVQDQKRDMWRKLNARTPVRPMVMIDNVPWNEMNVDDELTLRCADDECRAYEEQLRRTLYQWDHFSVDRVVEPYMCVPKAIHNSGFGIDVQEETAVTDATSAIVGHKYENQFQNDDDWQGICMPQITRDAAETERRLVVANELFDGVLEVRPSGAIRTCRCGM